MLDALASRLERAWWRDGDPLSLALAPLGWLYGTAWRAYAASFARGWQSRHRPDAAVLVIGNLVVGGAGKTPAVMATVRLMQERGYTPGIVSRGWGRQTDAVEEVQPASPASLVGDEPLLLRLRTKVPVFVGRDRPAAVAALLRKYPRTDLVVCDDGAQHLALARDVTVLVFDDRGAGNGRLLPAGPLREPMGRRAPPDSIVLYNAAVPSTRWRGATAQRRLAGVTELGAWWRGDAPSMPALEALRGRRIVAAAGIAQPEKFFVMLEAAGLELDRCPLPDHHDYETMPWRGAGDEAIVTEKDAVKLRPDRVGITRVWVATLDFEPEAGYADALRRRLPPPRRAS
jgi:tetraacyldisaccharide 4'-kinase